jgi:hypothetical protein
MIRILKDITFNEIEIIISINIRNFSEEITTFITFTEIIEIIEIIEKTSNINDADIANINDINIIFENIENAFFENITIESASIRKFTRYRKAIFKIVKINTMAVNIIEIAEASIIFIDKEESEKEDYLSKIIIAKLFIANEDKLTYEKAMADLKKF